MKKFRIHIDEVDYEVEVEELEGEINSSSTIKKSKQSKQNTFSKPNSEKTNKKIKKKPAKPSTGGEEELITAQMPGTIIDILVKEGEQIEKGQDLMILEAMKMENSIKASREGTVKKINVAENDSVDTGDQLAKIE